MKNLWNFFGIKTTNAYGREKEKISDLHIFSVGENTNGEGGVATNH